MAPIPEFVGVNNNESTKQPQNSQLLLRLNIVVGPACAQPDSQRGCGTDSILYHVGRSEVFLEYQRVGS